MNQPSFPLPDRLRRLLPLLLLGSLALNMFLLGAMVSHGGPHGPPHGPPDPRHLVERLAADLPAADAAILWQAYEAHRPTLDARHAHDPRDAMRQAIQDGLRADPFDPEALIGRLAEIDQDEQRFHRHIERHLIDAIATMSPEGRHRLAAFRP